MSRFRLVAAAAVAAAAAVTAVAVARGSGDPNAITPVQLAHATGTTPGALTIPGADVASIEQSVLARIGDPSLHADATSVDDAGGTEANFTVDVPSTGPAAIKPIWEAELAAGAMRDLVHDRGLGTIDNYLITVRTPDGSTQPSDSGFGNVAADQVFDQQSPATLRTQVKSGAASLGATLTSFQVVPGLQNALAIVVTAADPGAVVNKLQLQSTWQTLLGDYNNLEGYYFEARDESGAPFMITAVANRAGANASWIRPDLDPSSQAPSLPATGGVGG